MHEFKFKNSALYCENVSVSRIAQKVGTPFYLYSYATLIDHYSKLKKAFAEINPLICFSMKSNGNLAVVKSLIQKGAGLDIVSGGELKKALRINANPAKIAFASVGKNAQEIKEALRAGILFFTAESCAELKNINRIAKQLHKRASVAIRINPDVDANTHRAITTGTLKNKFGIDLKTTRTILNNQQQYPFVDFVGLHIHIGSQILSAEPFIRAVKKATVFLKVLESDGIRLKYFDIGGGLGIIYHKEKAQTARSFAKKVVPFLKKTGLRIVLEPGRFIAGNAGIFVTKVLYLKDNGFKKFLIVDGGMNDLVRPSLYDAYHEIVPVRRRHGKKISVDVVGPICESGDYLGKNRRMPQLAEGDLLAVMSAGAYGFVMSSNYNARCRVPEVIVKGNKFAVANKRETFRDLIKNEVIPSFIK